MLLTIKVIDRKGVVRAVESGKDRVSLCYCAAYVEGDTLCIESDAPSCFLIVHPEDSIPPAFVYLAGGVYRLPVPFGEKRISYSPKSFAGECHLLEARAATPTEVAQYKNLALNPLDCHSNTTLFPHAIANVETRGEAVFAARNAIDGNTANRGHGAWPYESWGINRQDDAALRVDFGRAVQIDKAIVTLRADFPHDNWWERATLHFSDGSSETLHFTKSDAPQECGFSPRTVRWAELCGLQKCTSDPSPFPALTQLALWGIEA